MDYGERLSHLNLTLVQKRFDRYRIFYTRKIILGHVPNVGLEIERERSERQGLKVKDSLSDIPARCTVIVLLLGVPKLLIYSLKSLEIH